MGVQLSEDEVRAALETAHTGVVTTLRRDGMPVSLPTWFVVLDGMVHFRTPARAKKVQRLDRDPRCCFLVESGERWAELQAVVLTGTAEPVADDGTRSAFEAAMDAKYAGFTTPRAAMPESAQRRYDRAQSMVYRIRPEDRRPITWDNRKLRLRPAGTEATGDQR